MLVSNNLKELIEEHQTPTLFLSKQAIKEAYSSLKNALPNYVGLYYALKANSHPVLVETLAELGANFDVCSKAEINLVNRVKKDSTKWIHTHPIKTPSTIHHAYENGLRTFVVDSYFELKKLFDHRDDIRLLIRVAIEESSAKIDFSNKFGVLGIDEALILITDAHELGFTNIGISFHCGSQAMKPKAFDQALSLSKGLILILKESGIQLSTVDIGGGFPNHPSLHDFDIAEYCKHFNEQLDDIHNEGIEIIAEPGRFIAADAMLLASKIIGKSRRKGKMWYYIDESIYNSFSGQVYDHISYPMTTLEDADNINLVPSVLAGQTCDSLDILQNNIDLPDLPIGTVLIFKNMGAYTSASASNFNGFPKTKIVTVDHF